MSSPGDATEYSMRVIDFNDFVKKGKPYRNKVSISIGVFDGLHRGHKKIIEGIISNQGTSPLIITFKQSPVAVLKKGVFPGYITTLRQKLDRMEKLGVTDIILIDFSLDFSRLSGKEFLDILNERLEIAKFVVGYNFGFGYKRDTDAGKLKEWAKKRGIETEIVQPVYYGNEVISSSRIRRAILSGEVEMANKMLVFGYSLRVEGLSPIGGESISSISYERNEFEQILPKAGSFEVELHGKDMPADTVSRGILRIKRDSVSLEGDTRGSIEEIIIKKRID